MSAPSEGKLSKPRERKSTTLSVLVPVFNEQHLLQSSLERLIVLADSPLLERIHVIAVDDGSRDKSPEVLALFQERCLSDGRRDKMEWTFLRHEKNRGKGAALRTALERVDTELCVTHDADLEYDPRDLLSMIPLFLQQDADAVFGSRFLAGSFRRVLFFRHSLGNRILTLLCNLVSDLNLTDMETCYKMARSELLRTIPLRSTDFRVEPELVIKLAKRGARIFEVPISYAGRTYEEGKKITWKDGFSALGAILRFAISDDIYTHDRFGSEILARLSRTPRFTRWMADVLRPHVGERVLEIGAGIGNLTVHLIPRTIYCASDINPLYLHRLESLQDTRPYFEALHTDVTRQESFPLVQRFDTVICLNVIEHVEDDVQALQNIRGVLSDGGNAIVLVPRYPRLFGSLDEVLGHQRRYTKARLEAVGRQAGLRLVKMLEFNRASVPAWWLNGRLLRRRTFGLIQIKLLNLLVPLFRAIERIRFLPSLSLIAIFEKEPLGDPAGAEGPGTLPATEEGQENQRTKSQDATLKSRT